VGRSCVHPDYRDGATITQLWSGLADYIGKHNHEYLIGCASISMADGGHYAASVYHKIHKLHAAPAEYSVYPHCRLPLEALNRNLEVAIPPLIKGYLRLGAYIAGLQLRRPVHPVAGGASQRALRQALHAQSRITLPGLLPCAHSWCALFLLE